MRDAACAEVGACCCTKLSPGAKAQVDRVSQALRAFSDVQQKTVRVSSLFALVGDGRWLRCGQSTTTYGVQVRRVFHFSWQPTGDPFHRAASRVVTWEGGEADDRQVLFPPWAVPVAAQSPAAGGGRQGPQIGRRGRLWVFCRWHQEDVHRHVQRLWRSMRWSAAGRHLDGPLRRARRR